MCVGWMLASSSSRSSSRVNTATSSDKLDAARVWGGLGAVWNSSRAHGARGRGKLDAAGV